MRSICAGECKPRRIFDFFVEPQKPSTTNSSMASRIEIDNSVSQLPVCMTLLLRSKLIQANQEHTSDVSPYQPACPTDDEFSATIAKLDEASSTTELCRQMLYFSWDSLAQLNTTLKSTQEVHSKLMNSYTELQQAHHETAERFDQLRNSYCSLSRDWKQSCGLLQEYETMVKDYLQESPSCQCEKHSASSARYVEQDARVQQLERETRARPRVLSIQDHSLFSTTITMQEEGAITRAKGQGAGKGWETKTNPYVRGRFRYFHHTDN